jgi:hypothetical protein
VHAGAPQAQPSIKAHSIRSKDLTLNPITLTPIQIRGLKLAMDGDLFPQDAKKWTHLNAVVTYAKTDRFKERPQKIKFLSTNTLTELREVGFVQPLDPDAEVERTAHSITMAGKIWLLKNK